MIDQFVGCRLNALEVVASEKREIGKFFLTKKFSPFNTGKKKMPLLKRGPLPKFTKKKNRKCLKSSTWPDSRHQNWPSMGMFLLRKNISHLCDFLQESLRGLFQCSAHRLQLLGHSLYVVLPGSPMCSPHGKASIQGYKIKHCGDKGHGRGDISFTTRWIPL